MLDELLNALDRALTGTPEQSVESAIMIYLAAQAQIETFEAVGKKAKQLISDVMAETGKTNYRTDAGTVAVSSPGVTITYDSKALDALCQSLPDLAEVLGPHRKVTERAGTLRVTARKS